MATKEVVVTITKRLKLHINDELLTEESLKEFSEFMWEIDGPDGIFKYAARMAAEYGASSHDFLGDISTYPTEASVRFNTLEEDVEVELK